MQRKKIGDIVAIPIGERYIFGRILKDEGIEVYHFLGSTKTYPENLSMYPIILANGCHDSAIKQGKWEIVGHIPFHSEEEMWVPPRKIIDDLNPKNHQIYHKGEIVCVNEGEVRDMEEQCFYRGIDGDQLIEELQKRINTF